MRFIIIPIAVILLIVIVLYWTMPLWKRIGKDVVDHTNKSLEEDKSEVQEREH